MVYVVWEGRETGLFNSWSEVEPLVKGYKGSKFKRFEDDKEAEKAFKEGFDGFDVLHKIKEESKKSDSFLPDSLYCEANYDNDSSLLNVKLMDVESGMIVEEEEVSIFTCSYNLGQFIGLCKGLDFILANGKYRNLYSNATPAIYWAREKRVGSGYKHNEVVMNIIDFGIATIELLEDEGFGVQFLKTPASLKKEVKLK